MSENGLGASSFAQPFILKCITIPRRRKQSRPGSLTSSLLFLRRRKGNSPGPLHFGLTCPYVDVSKARRHNQTATTAEDHYETPSRTNLSTGNTSHTQALTRTHTHPPTHTSCSAFPVVGRGGGGGWGELLLWPYVYLST